MAGLENETQLAMLYDTHGPTAVGRHHDELHISDPVQGQPYRVQNGGPVKRVAARIHISQHHVAILTGQVGDAPVDHHRQPCCKVAGRQQVTEAAKPHGLVYVLSPGQQLRRRQ